MTREFLRPLLVLALLIGTISCAPNRRTVAPAPPADDVALMSFNIRQSGMARTDGPDRWEKRRKAVLAMIDTENPAVIGLQEGLIDQVRRIEKRCPQYTRIGVGRDDGAEGGEIMALFYRNDRFEAPASGTFWLSATPDRVSRGWDAACNRTVTWALLREKTTGREFYYFNNHFDHAGETARRESARQLAEYIRREVPAGATVIVGGDFNSDIADPALEPLKAALDVARDIADPTDRKGTYNGFGAAPNNIVIDHIFCRNAGKTSLRVLRGDYGAPFISDHYPVVLTFRLP